MIENLRDSRIETLPFRSPFTKEGSRGCVFPELFTLTPPLFKGGDSVITSSAHCPTTRVQVCSQNRYIFRVHRFGLPISIFLFPPPTPPAGDNHHPYPQDLSCYRLQEAADKQRLSAPPEILFYGTRVACSSYV